MSDEIAKQKETIHFLDGHLTNALGKLQKQKAVILEQGKLIHEFQREIDKLKDVVRLQGKLLNEKNQRSTEFDKELYLYELFKYDTVKPQQRLASKTSVSYTYDTEKNRKKVTAFRRELERIGVMKTLANATVAWVDYTEAKRLLGFGEFKK